jgi:uncharacterized protein YdeI (YjbR/CyaY-like superfamily)
MAKTRAKATSGRTADKPDDRPHVSPRSRKEWRAWLQKHHTSSTAVWLLFPKKHTGLAAPSYNDAVEEALCFGWIDGLVNPVDAAYYKQLFTPRKAKSGWAQSNKTRVARLIEQGLMTSAGLAAIETANANGSWTTLDHAEALKVSPELQRALNANAAAKKRWPAFTDGQRKQFLYWLAMAKREETRAKRIATIVEMAARGMTPAMRDDARRRAVRDKKPASASERG